jgi:hypothetical protein
MTDRVQDMVDELMGTCMMSPDFEDWTMEELEEFDDMIFECTICGWWYEIGELGDSHDELACVECTTEEEEDD